MAQFNVFFKNKRVLVTGHTGFKGSWLCEWLLKLGAEVAGYSIDVPTEPSHFEELQLVHRIKHYLGDVREFNRVREAFESFRPQVVFHLAAQPIVTESFKNPLLTFSTNLMGTVNVLEMIRTLPSLESAVIVTSDKCYENVEWEYGYRETDRLGGKDPYSASKACAEIAFASYYRSFFQKGSVPIASARAGNVIGGGDWAKDRIVPDCIRAWKKGESAFLRNPYATRPWQHVLEPLSGYLLLAASLVNGNGKLAGESFNFGPPAEVNFPVLGLIEKIGKYWPGTKWHYDSPSQSEVKREASLLKLNCDKALFHLGWKPTLNFEETAEMTAQWYFQNQGPQAKNLTLDQIERYERKAYPKDH